MLKPAQLTKILKKFQQLPKAHLEAPLREAEEEQKILWNALNHIAGGIVILQKNRPIFLNQQAMNFFGISESSNWRQDLQLLIQKTQVASWIQKEIIDAENGFRNRLFFIDSKALIVSLEGPRDSEELRYFTFIDITSNLDEVEEVLRTEKIESLSKLVAYVAHEIKNPLHSLQLHLKILENEISELTEAKKTRIKKTLTVLLEETQRLDALTHQFLKLGQLKDRIPVATDINRLLESVVDVVRPELDLRDVELLTAFDKRLPKVLVQKDKMYQAFLNLAKNALEALPKKGGKLALRTSKAEDWCRIEFRDNGQGIAPKDLDRIFEPYFSTKKEGSGLGLVFVKETVEDIRGKIQVESSKGKGSLFTIYLPLKKEQLKLPRGSK